MSNLILHAGGWKATRAELASVPVPSETDSYMPIPYPRLLEEIELQLPRFDLKIKDANFALAHEGGQMFGVYTLGHQDETVDWALALGIRSSYDRSLSVGLVMGSHVFCCDNLAFNGEVASRKHTRNIFRDLPMITYDLLYRGSNLAQTVKVDIERMKERELNVIDADHMLVDSVRQNILPASSLPKVIGEWEEPKHKEFEPRNAWSLYNAFTEVMKTRSPELQMKNTLKLSQLFRQN